MILGAGMPPLKTLYIWKALNSASHKREYGLVLPTMYHTVQDSTGSGRMNESVFSLETPY